MSDQIVERFANELFPIVDGYIVIVVVADSDLLETSPYNQIYGRLPLPTRGFIPPQPRQMYIGEWD